MFPSCIVFMQVAERGLDTAKQEVKHLLKGLKASCVSLLHLVHAGGGKRA